MSRLALAAVALPILFGCGGAPVRPPSARLEFLPGDRIVFVGNTFAERLQLESHFETMLTAALPDLRLTFRNLGWSADTLTLKPRPAAFGSEDEHLRAQRADVVFACYGMNESFEGEAGLGKFRSDCEALIVRVRQATWNRGRGKDVVISGERRFAGIADGRTDERPVRLVLVGPIAHEHLGGSLASREFVDRHNRNLKLYSEALCGLASQHGVPFIDLLAPARTINGIHLSAEGDREVGARMMAALGIPVPPVDEELRAAIVEKNRHFFRLWRAVNGCYIYGERKKPFGVGNFPAENAKLESMILAAEERIARRAPRPAPRKESAPIAKDDPADALRALQPAAGFDVGLFASERQFPDLRNPLCMTFDARGRLWVATMPSYPQYDPHGPEPDDRLLILEDTDRDGRADRCTTFADRLYLPTGFELGDGGVYVGQQPNLWFLRDTDGDDRADERRLILHGFGTEDSHHALHAFTWGPGGELYFQEGTFFHTQVETPRGPVRCQDAGVYRYEPRSAKLSVFVSYPFANPWGHVVDRWGQNFVSDASGGANYFGTAFSGHVDYPAKHAGMEQWIPAIMRPTARSEIVSSRHFPPEMQGHFLLTNVIGLQGVMRYTRDEAGSGFAGKPVEPLLRSTDASFRPVDIQFGPDGALYVCDWHNPLIGHMQYSLRDPRRDRVHGRIWRVTAKGRPLLRDERLDRKSIDELLDALKEPEDRLRYRARRELRDRPTREVLDAIRRWTASDPHDGLEALWVQQHHDAVDRELLKRVLRSGEPRARAAAVRVLQAIEGPLDLFRAAALDEFPRTRLEAVRAMSFHARPEAAEIALDAAGRPMDTYLTYALKETLRTLQPQWRPALQAGRLRVGSAEAVRFLMREFGVRDFKGLDERIVNRIRIESPGVARDVRRKALEDLARAENVRALDLLLATPAAHELLPGWDRAELAGALDRIRRLGSREAYAAWVVADGSGDGAYAAASKSIDGLVAFLGAVPLVPDAALRASLYARVRPLMSRLPDTLGPPATGLRVEVFAKAPADAAAETFDRLAPGVAADVKTIGLDFPQRPANDNFGLRFTGTLHVVTPARTTFHLASDDGSRLYIDGTLVVNNDGLHVMAEKSGSIELAAGAHALVLTYFNARGGQGLSLHWERPGMAKQPVPEAALGGPDPAAPVRRAAIRAIAHVPARDEDRFRALVVAVRAGGDIDDAVASILSVPGPWPADETRSLGAAVVALLARTPMDQRDAPSYRNMLKLGERLPELRETLKEIASPAADAGRRVYLTSCVQCHQLDGRGLPGAYPPLAGSDWLDDDDRLIKITLHGLMGTIKVNGVEYSSGMDPLGALLSDEEVAAVLTYARNSWDNRGPAVAAERVARVRAAVGERAERWMGEQLLKEHPRKR